MTPDPFSPNGDGQDDVAQISYTPAEAVQSRVSVVDADAKVLRRLGSWAWVSDFGAEGHLGRPHPLGRQADAGPRGRRDRAGRDPRHGRQHHDRAAQGHHRPDARPGRRLARHVLAQRRRRDRRCHPFVQADPRGRRHRYRPPRGLRGADDATRAARRGQAVGHLGRQARRGRDGDERAIHTQADGRRSARRHVGGSGGHRRPRGSSGDRASDGACGVSQDRQGSPVRPGMPTARWSRSARR